VYSIKRVADQKNASTGYWAFNDRIVGLDEFRAATAGSLPTDYAMPVEGLRAVDRYTLRIRLKRPYPQLLWILSMHYAAALPREAVEFYGDDFVNHPVGTGPFVLESWRRNHRVVYARNPAWRRTGRDVEELRRMGEGENGGVGEWESGGMGEGEREDAFPQMDRIVEYVIDDSSTRWLCFLRGQIDLYTDISRDNWDVVITPDLELDERLRDMGVHLSSIAGLDTFYTAFNMDDPVVGTNRKLRQALTCAFNSEEWTRFYNHRITRAKGPIPPGVAGHWQGPSLYPFDLEQARKLLAEAGYPEGRDPKTGKRLKLTLELGRTDLETRESTELFIGFMDKIGVVIEPSYNNWPTFLRKLGRRQAQMFRVGWIADYPDAENFLQLFYGPNSSPGPNRSNYVNPEFDRLYEQVREMSDSPKRTELYRRMAKIVVEDAPWIFMYHRMDYTLHYDRLKDYVPHDFPYGMDKYYRVEAPRESGARNSNIEANAKHE